MLAASSRVLGIGWGVVWPYLLQAGWGVMAVSGTGGRGSGYRAIVLGQAGVGVGAVVDVVDVGETGVGRSERVVLRALGHADPEQLEHG